MIFVKYRHHWAFGDDDWEYMLYSKVSDKFSKQDREQVEDDLAYKHQYSDTYRGCTVVRIKNPPKGWIASQIEFWERKAVMAKDYCEFYKNLLNLDSN